MLPHVHPYGNGITMTDHFPPMMLNEVERLVVQGKRIWTLMHAKNIVDLWLLLILD